MYRNHGAYIYNVRKIKFFLRPEITDMGYRKSNPGSDEHSGYSRKKEWRNRK